MENDCVTKTEFGLLRRLDPPFQEQTQGQQMFQMCIRDSSYRDLPLRMAELGLVHRHEMSGALHGLFRVRCFTQDDACLLYTSRCV